MKITDKCMAVRLGGLTPLHFSYFIFFLSSNVCHSVCVWPTALKLSCITNFDMLLLMIGFISLVDEIQFMVSSGHFA